MKFFRAHRTLLLLGLIVLAGFAVRALWVTRMHASEFPRSIPAGGDADPCLLGYDGVRFDIAASNLADRGIYGQTLGSSDSWRPPGYPLFLAASYIIFGRNFLVVRFLQALMGAAQIVLVFLVTRRLSGSDGRALLAAAICALAYDLAFFAGVFYSEPLSALCVSGAILLLLFAFGKKKRVSWPACLGAFLLLGYAALVRPGNIFFIPVALAFVWLESSPKLRWRAALIGVAAFGLVLVPWSIRNYRLHGRWVPFTTHGGLVFFIAHHPKSYGSFVPESERYSVEQKFELQDLGAVDTDRLHYQFAFRAMASAPLHELAIVLRKQWFLWTWVENSNPVVAMLDSIPLPLLAFNSIAVFGLMGAIFRAREWRKLLLIYGWIVSYCVMLSVIFYYHGPRTRVELIPPLCVLAGMGIVDLLEKARARPPEKKRR